MLFRSGHKLEDFKKVIDNMTIQWINNKDMNMYLRPETLFGTKFEGYLNQEVTQEIKRRGKLDDLIGGNN